MLRFEDTSEFKGKRLDTLSLTILKEQGMDVPSRSFLKDNWGDWIKINEKKVKPSYKIKEGDFLSIDDDYILKAIADINRGQDIVSQKGDLDIVYEDMNYLVLNKQKGVVVHPGVGNEDNTLANYVKHYLLSKGEYDDAVERAGIVHRLDKGVSGLIVFAKNAHVQRDLKEQFENHTVQKLYIAEVEKQNLDKEFDQHLSKIEDIYKVIEKLEKDTFEVDSSWYKAAGYMGRDNTNRMRMKFKSYEFGGSKKALSYIKRVGENKYLIKIETGRMHQIRATLKSLGMVICNDTLYENSKAKIISSDIKLESVYLRFQDLNGKNIALNLLRR